MHTFSRIPATYFAATHSFPGGLVVLMRIRSISQPVASRASAVVSGPATGAAAARETFCCATSGAIAPKTSNATPSSTPGVLRFNIGKAPSLNVQKTFCLKNASYYHAGEEACPLHAAELSIVHDAGSWRFAREAALMAPSFARRAIP